MKKDLEALASKEEINKMLEDFHKQDIILTHNPLKKGEAMRFNEGKLRYDLAPAYAQKKYIEVLTKGALKYAERNWEKGMPWSKVIASLERHLAEFKQGIDYDEETGCLHTAQIMCNAAFLTEYYKIFPQGDDRPVSYLQYPKIGLDIDGVICDWCQAWAKRYNLPYPMTQWSFSYDNYERFKAFTPEEMDEFYLSIPPHFEGKDIPFEPHCYITARSVPVEITKKWIEKNNFPTAPVYSVGFGESKVEVAKKAGIDVFVDDSFANFAELNNAGIFTYLYTASYNERYNVGARRINNLKEVLIKK